MRLLLVALPLATAACGPQLAFISNDEVVLPPSAVSGPVATREPAPGPAISPSLGARATTGHLAAAQVRAPGSDAGPHTPADAGPSAGPDAGAAEAPDAGLLFPDAGPGWFDAGVVGSAGLQVSVHLALGLPDESGVGRADRWLLVRSQLVSSYNTGKKVPNWTSWRLAAADLGSATRATSFRMDPLLPSGVAQARDADYTNSGFDRGHLCPSADRTASDADNDATFFLTNVVPQTHASNAGPWLTLEDEARTLARAGKQLLIIAGPIFGSTRQTVGTGVEVPLSMFKVLVVLDQAPAPGAVTTSTRVYAAIIPNAAVLSGSWRQWQVTVRDVEQQTGLNFLSDVPQGVQDVVELRRDP